MKISANVRALLGTGILLACIGLSVPVCTAAEDGGAGGHSGGGGGQDAGSGGHDSGGSHESGGGCSGGGCGGGGSGSGGHESGGGGCSGGGCGGGGGGQGGLKYRHGLNPDHPGHASGVHDSMDSGQGYGQRFGGDSGIVGAEQIMEGPAENPMQGYGPGPQFRNQFRYWGGWTLPGEGGGVEGDDGVPTDPGFNTGGGGGTGTAFHLVGEQRCGDMVALNAVSRLEGRNLERFRAVRTALTPGAQPRASAILMLANYQAELEKQSPDPVLAGTYLGMVARIPVTSQLIARVNSSLCIVLPEEQRGEIARVAEEQRLSLRGKAK